MPSLAEDVATMLHRRVRKEQHLREAVHDNVGWDRLTHEQKEAWRHLAADLLNDLAEKADNPAAIAPEGYVRVRGYNRHRSTASVKSTTKP